MARGYIVMCLAAAVLVSGNPSAAVPGVSFEAVSTLFDVEDRVTINSVSDPVPVYRKDLASDYVAYWQYVVNSNEQIIVSAGPKTGDYKLVFQGSLPSMTGILDDIARGRGQHCVRYYMLSPEIVLTCENSDGRIVATTRDSYIKHDANDTTLRYQFVEKNYGSLHEGWKLRLQEVNEEGVWDDTSVIPKEDITRMKGQRESEDQGLIILRPGQTFRIPVAGATHVKLATPNHQEHKLCQMLKICTADSRGVVDISSPDSTPYGMKFISMTVPEGTSGKDVRFDLDVMTPSGLVVKRFYLDLSRRHKRGATYSAWTYTSIRDENLFPDYDQFKDGKCEVGCGPVAWAMIFGYFDRRSHIKVSTYGSGSQNLFRCSADGTTGAASCVAPSRNNPAVENYIKSLKRTLRTFCLFGQGATRQGNMDRVKGFFGDRQTRSPAIVRHRRPVLGFFGAYSNKIRDRGLAAIRAGWPIIAGIRVKGLFSQHYPVATRYRSRVKSERKCFLWKCWTKRTTQYDMYLHMGWGGRQNGWRSAKMFFAIYARY